MYQDEEKKMVSKYNKRKKNKFYTKNPIGLLMIFLIRSKYVQILTRL